ncbi:glycoside hydrolase family 3 C-terminal domain-containing protein [Paenibacillus turpanensis]|uniref:glycoside hydrolase family 3 C-terminal domain-containing protein n=1 Tax=Paenibacillus turpanensis TaxID=2689078 RepID=UPI0014086BE6|nr:glycoside hydrolase family 3 C-terminal domain-containing protein [Paenibacillus turpanensis]
MLKRFLGLALSSCLVLTASIPAAAAEVSMTGTSYDYPFRNPDLPLETRVDDLVSRLTLPEKVSLMHQYQPAIPRLGIPAFRTGTEGLHGIAWLGEATVFPQATGLANTWNTELVEQIGSAVGDEARAFYKRNPVSHGLSVWAPVVDLIRDPRSGRNEEGFGEDAMLSGTMGKAYASGMKGNDPFYLKTIPTLKHFTGYNNEKDRGFSSSSIDPRNMYEYYAKSFEPAIKSGAALSVMPAYNSINGKPAIASPLINDLIRKEWAKEGLFVVSDAFDPTGTVTDHKYVETYPEAMALAIKAGVDSMTDQGENSAVIIGYIHQALEQGLITEEDIDRAVKHMFMVRFRLGEFDPPERNPYAGIQEDVINSEAHQQLALQAAREQLVLLKNERQALPLNKQKINKLAVIGPLADQVLTDFYSGTFPYTVSTLEGIQSKMPAQSVAFSRGVDRIALQSVTSGNYVTANPDGKTPLEASAGEIGTNETFDLYDLGWDQFLFRARANDRYLQNLWGNPDVLNDGDAPGANQWFTYQNYRYEKQQDGTYSLYNYQSGHWDTSLEGGRYVTVSDAAPYRLSTSKESITGDAEKFRETVVVNGEEEAAAAAQGADAAIVVVGHFPQINARETIDRADLILPPEQEALIEKVASVNRNTIVVVVSGFPMAMPKVERNPNVKAILYSAHGGQEEGTAIADALFGDYAPAGRLNQTWYEGVHQLPDMMEYDIRKGNRTYQYFDGKPLYPFGHGLTYTRFKYSNLRLEQRAVDANGEITVSVDVTNTGSIASDEVVQLYTRANHSRVERPIKELKAFQRLSFQPKQKRTVTFRLPANDLQFWDVTQEKFVVESGIYTIMVGSSSEDIKEKALLKVNGETIPNRDLFVETRAENYDDYAGVRLVEDRETTGSSVGETESGAWIMFKDVDFGSGASSWEARAASETGGKVEVRLDHPRGRVVSTLDVPQTGGLQQWTSVSSAVYGAERVRDVYLTFDGSLNLSSFRFNPSHASLTLTAPESAAAGEVFSVNLGVSNVTESVYEQRVTLLFNPHQLELAEGELSIEPTVPGTKINDVQIGHGRISIDARFSPTDTSGTSQAPGVQIRMKAKEARRDTVSTLAVIRGELVTSSGASVKLKPQKLRIHLKRP